MNAKNKVKVRYDSDADVLSIEGHPHAVIDHAKEMGNLVVHFGKNDEPILIEVLEASRTLRGQLRPLQQVATFAE
ncbi:MAG: DUF2283 domain-containing protein [Patescibacteria group bacterium]